MPSCERSRNFDDDLDGLLGLLKCSVTMTLLLLYVMFTLCCCGYALAAGGVTGRAGGIVILTKTVLDLSTAWINYSWQETMYPLLVIDVVCLFCFIALALRSDRLWPLWATGFQFVAVLIHLATVWEIDIAPKAYQALQQFWTIPMQLVMLSGIMADQRMRFSGALRGNMESRRTG